MSHSEKEGSRGILGLGKKALLSELSYRLKVLATRRGASSGRKDLILQHTIKELDRLSK